MNLAFVLQAVREHVAVAVCLLVVGIGTGMFLTWFVSPKYEATAQIIITVDPGAGTSESNVNRIDDSEYVRNQLPTYVEYARSADVLRPAMNKLGLTMSLDEFTDHLQFAVPSDTVVMNISATRKSPQKAADSANAVAESVGRHLPGFGSDDDATKTVTVDVFAPASAPTRPAVGSWVHLGQGAIGGLIAGVVVSLTLKLRDPYFHSSDDIAELAGAPVIGNLKRRWRNGQLRRLIARNRVDDRTRAIPATVEGIYARLHLANSARRPRILTVISPVSNTMSADVVWELACVAAKSGVTTAVVGSTPDIRRYFISRQTATLEMNASISVVCPNTHEAFPGGVVSTADLSIALESVLPTVDLVLIAAPAQNDAPNMRSYLDVSDRVVLAIDSRTTRHDLQTAVEAVQQSDSELAGIIVANRPEFHPGRIRHWLGPPVPLTATTRKET